MKEDSNNCGRSSMELLYDGPFYLQKTFLVFPKDKGIQS